MTTYLTVKEAATTTGRSPSSIHRFIHPIIKNDQHPDRPLIEPGLDEVRELRLRGEKFAWRISEELLSRAFAARQEPVSANQSPSLGVGERQPLQEVIAILREQLQNTQAQLVVKDEQIAVKDQQIANLSEITRSLNDRLHEGNVLFATLQKQFALPDASPVTKPVPKDVAKKTESLSARPTTKRSESRPTSPAAKKQSKKGFFARLFSPGKVN